MHNSQAEVGNFPLRSPEDSQVHIVSKSNSLSENKNQNNIEMTSSTMVSFAEVVAAPRVLISLPEKQTAAPKISEVEIASRASTLTKQLSQSDLAYSSANGALQPKVQQIVKATGNYFHLSDGSVVFDAVGGAAVTSIGHGDVRVKNAICDQIDIVEYCRSTLFSTKASTDLAAHLVRTTGGAMRRAMIVSSGMYHAPHCSANCCSLLTMSA